LSPGQCVWVFVGCHGITPVALFYLWYMVMQTSTVAVVTRCVVCDVCIEAEETGMLSMQDIIAESDYINSWFTGYVKKQPRTSHEVVRECYDS